MQQQHYRQQQRQNVGASRNTQEAPQSFWNGNKNHLELIALKTRKRASVRPANQDIANTLSPRELRQQSYLQRKAASRFAQRDNTQTKSNNQLVSCRTIDGSEVGLGFKNQLVTPSSLYQQQHLSTPNLSLPRGAIVVAPATGQQGEMLGTLVPAPAPSTKTPFIKQSSSKFLREMASPQPNLLVLKKGKQLFQHQQQQQQQQQLVSIDTGFEDGSTFPDVFRASTVPFKKDFFTTIDGRTSTHRTLITSTGSGGQSKALLHSTSSINNLHSNSTAAAAVVGHRKSDQGQLEDGGSLKKRFKRHAQIKSRDPRSFYSHIDLVTSGLLSPVQHQASSALQKEVAKKFISNTTSQRNLALLQQMRGGVSNIERLESMYGSRNSATATTQQQHHVVLKAAAAAGAGNINKHGVATTRKVQIKGTKKQSQCQEDQATTPVQQHQQHYQHQHQHQHQGVLTQPTQMMSKDSVVCDNGGGGGGGGVGFVADMKRQMEMISPRHAAIAGEESLQLPSINNRLTVEQPSNKTANPVVLIKPVAAVGMTTNKTTSSNNIRARTKLKSFSHGIKAAMSPRTLATQIASQVASTSQLKEGTAAQSSRMYTSLTGVVNTAISNYASAANLRGGNTTTPTVATATAAAAANHVIMDPHRLMTVTIDSAHQQHHLYHPLTAQKKSEPIVATAGVVNLGHCPPMSPGQQTDSVGTEMLLREREEDPFINCPSTMQHINAKQRSSRGDMDLMNTIDDSMTGESVVHLKAQRKKRQPSQRQRQVVQKEEEQTTTTVPSHKQQLGTISATVAEVNGRMTPKIQISASIEDFYSSKEANRMCLLQSITATNRRIKAQKGPAAVDYQQTLQSVGTIATQELRCQDQEHDEVDKYDKNDQNQLRSGIQEISQGVQQITQMVHVNVLPLQEADLHHGGSTSSCKADGTVEIGSVDDQQEASAVCLLPKVLPSEDGMLDRKETEREGRKRARVAKNRVRSQVECSEAPLLPPQPVEQNAQETKKVNGKKICTKLATRRGSTLPMNDSIELLSCGGPANAGSNLSGRLVDSFQRAADQSGSINAIRMLASIEPLRQNRLVSNGQKQRRKSTRSEAEEKNCEGARKGLKELLVQNRQSSQRYDESTVKVRESSHDVQSLTYRGQSLSSPAAAAETKFNTKRPSTLLLELDPSTTLQKERLTQGQFNLMTLQAKQKLSEISSPKHQLTHDLIQALEQNQVAASPAEKAAALQASEQPPYESRQKLQHQKALQLHLEHQAKKNSILIQNQRSVELNQMVEVLCVDTSVQPSPQKNSSLVKQDRKVLGTGPVRYEKLIKEQHDLIEEGIGTLHGSGHELGCSGVGDDTKKVATSTILIDQQGYGGDGQQEQKTRQRRGRAATKEILHSEVVQLVELSLARVSERNKQFVRQMSTLMLDSTHLTNMVQQSPLKDKQYLSNETSCVLNPSDQQNSHLLHGTGGKIMLDRSSVRGADNNTFNELVSTEKKPIQGSTATKKESGQKVKGADTESQEEQLLRVSAHMKIDVQRSSKLSPSKAQEQLRVGGGRNEVSMESQAIEWRAVEQHQPQLKSMVLRKGATTILPNKIKKQASKAAFQSQVLSNLKMAAKSQNNLDKAINGMKPVNNNKPSKDAKRNNGSSSARQQQIKSPPK